MYLLFLSIIWGALFTLPYLLISSAIDGSKKQREKALDLAIARQHRVTAVLKRRYNALGSDSNYALNPYHYRYWSIYEYEYKGRSYKFRAYMDEPPSTLTLFFVRNPRRANVMKALSNDTFLRFVPYVFLLNTVLFYLVLPSM